MSTYLIDSQTLTDTADAIRTKKGTQAGIQVSNFPSEILSIPTGGGGGRILTSPSSLNSTKLGPLFRYNNTLYMFGATPSNVVLSGSGSGDSIDTLVKRSPYASTSYPSAVLVANDKVYVLTQQYASSRYKYYVRDMSLPSFAQGSEYSVIDNISSVSNTSGFLLFAHNGNIYVYVSYNDSIYKFNNGVFQFLTLTGVTQGYAYSVLNLGNSVYFMKGYYIIKSSDGFTTKNVYQPASGSPAASWSATETCHLLTDGTDVYVMKSNTNYNAIILGKATFDDAHDTYTISYDKTYYGFVNPTYFIKDDMPNVGPIYWIGGVWCKVDTNGNLVAV